MHPQRTALHNELHARPSLYFDGPAHVFHLALLGGDAACAALLQRCCPEAQDINAAQGITRLDGHPFKWERHTEFFTLTLVVPCSTANTEWQALPQVLAEAIAPQTAQVINAVQVLVRDEQDLDLSHYGFKDPCGSCVGGGDASVWSDFRLTEDGTNRFLFINRRLNAYRQGRMIRRLLEIETYRMMASLTLTTAKALSQELDAFDKTLVSLSERSAGGDGHDSKGLLDAIALLSRQVVSHTVRTRHRFGATQAYAQLVFERLAELRESHVGDCQRLGVFIERRFKPTVRYCAATEQRLEQLAKNVANLGDLLQARVQVEMEEQNAEILRSLNARADAQVKIQRAVEGLSIIAITYYLLNLFKLLYGGLNVLGVGLTARDGLLAMAPPVLLVLLVILVRIRQAKQH
ncbi:putative membrane-anchored protein [Pseudomonas sp. Y3 TE3536]